MWQNSKTQIVTKENKSSDDKTKNNQIVTESKTIFVLQNSNCDKTQKLKLRQNLKTKIVTKLKNPNCDKTKKIKFSQNKKK